MKYTDETWALATPEEKEAELERCKNPVYVYNHYIKQKSAKNISETDFIYMIAVGRLMTFKPRRPDLWPPKGLLEQETERVRKEFNLQ